MATFSLIFGLSLFTSILLVLSFSMSSFLRASTRPDLMVGTNRAIARNRKRFSYR